MEVKDISKSYGKKEVLQNISFSAGKGECIGLLGGNGSGKSTFLSILAGVQRAGGGEFIHNGVNLLKNSAQRSAVVGYVPQSTPLLEELTAKDNLRLWYDPEDMQHQLKNGVLAMLGIDEFLKVPVRKMSGGMKKRLSIGCAVAHRPEILLLDEPSAALDLLCKERISNYLKEYKSFGGTVILATHDLQELPLCDRMYILKNGVLNPYEYDGDVHRLAGSL
ncbi:MAG: ABC transporter ATP-binding protein [Clostridia bacterium]|nr:ABC transporter ATP-binding protein [Clostridia bacterium]